MFKQSHTSPLVATYRNLQIQLFPPHLKHKIPRNYKTSIAPSNLHYLELEIFKQQLSGFGQNILFQTYRSTCKKIRNYKLVFLGIGLFFLALSSFIFQHNLLFFTVIFGNLSVFAKGCLMGLSMCLAFFSAWVGYSLNVVSEACSQLLSRAKCKLIQAYSCKRLDAGFQNILFWKNDHHKHFTLKMKYHQTLHALEEQKEHTLQLLQKIQNYDNIETSYRELLFNQALCELNTKCDLIISNFKEDI